MSEVAIIEYGMGNIQSVANAFEKVGARPVLVHNADELGSYDHVVLPGVGAFRAAMEHLHEADGLIEALNQHVKAGKPILGICLGMQLLAKTSQEGGETQGLGWIDAEVVPFEIDTALKIPHMGWNALKQMHSHAVLDGFNDGSDVYFVHSYHMQCANPDNVLLTCEYGGEFTAVVADENVIGMQFHPEKSQNVGLRMLANFLEI